ncbi:MAG: DUF6115 domain-containing protein [Thermodesulforhabdaceae bacterium]
MGTALSWLDYLHFAFNAVLIVLLSVLIFRKKPEKTSRHEEEAYEKAQALARSLTEIAKEHETIARQFEINLENKKLLIRDLTTQLDRLLTEAKEITSRLEKLLRAAQEIETGAHFNIKNPEHEKIIQLAQKGFTIQSIAQQMQKPIGEVELIINLYKASLKKKDYD